MPSAPRIAYLTDVEGMWPRLASFASANPLVTLDSGDALQVAAGAVLVFGGDAIDRGPSGRRIVRCLLGAKLRQPDQVILLAGNRDINKLRLRRELLVKPHPRSPPELFKPGDPLRTSELLKWTFSQTMGAGEAFEHRRAELAGESGLPGVDDAQVTRSYLDDLAPAGELTRYLALCQLAFRAGPTLFVHGGLTAQSLAHVPGSDRRHAEVDGWAGELNGWYRRQLVAYVEGRLEADGTPVWQQVIAYQAPLPGTRVNPGSVVYGRLTDDLLNPFLPSREVIDQLRAAGIGRLLVGHTPSGDSPSILRAPDFEMIIADNSHARLPGASQVFIEGEDLKIRAAAVLDSGEARALSFGLKLGVADERVGLRQASTGALLKGPTVEGDLLLWRGLPGFKIEQTALSLEARASFLLDGPRGPRLSGPRAARIRGR